MHGRLPLSTLLSHALTAFTIEFDNEFEHRMPHRTTNRGSTAGSRHAPWLVSMVMWSNFMQFVGERGGYRPRVAAPATDRRYGRLIPVDAIAAVSPLPLAPRLSMNRPVLNRLILSSEPQTSSKTPRLPPPLRPSALKSTVSTPLTPLRRQPPTHTKAMKPKGEATETVVNIGAAGRGQPPPPPNPTRLECAPATSHFSKMQHTTPEMSW
jgi:hypothetical protein